MCATEPLVTESGAFEVEITKKYNRSGLKIVNASHSQINQYVVILIEIAIKS